MSTNPNYLSPSRNRFPLNLYRKLPLVNSLSLNQSETVFKIKFWSTTFWTYDSSTDQCLNEYVRNAREKKGSFTCMLWLWQIYIYICKMLISIFSWFYHTIFKVLTTQILYPKCSRMHHFDVAQGVAFLTNFRIICNHNKNIQYPCL